MLAKEGAKHNQTSITNQPSRVGEVERGFCVSAHTLGLNLNVASGRALPFSLFLNSALECFSKRVAVYQGGCLCIELHFCSLSRSEWIELIGTGHGMWPPYLSPGS
jgi:hypothetical protein